MLYPAIDTDSNKPATADEIGAYFFYQSGCSQGRHEGKLALISQNSATLAQAMIDKVDEREGEGAFLMRSRSDTDLLRSDFFFGFDDIDFNLAFSATHKDLIMQVMDDILTNHIGTTLKKWTKGFKSKEVHDFDLIMVLNYLTVGSNVLNPEQVLIYEILINIILDEVLFWSLLEYELLQEGS